MTFLRINIMSFQPINLMSAISLHEGYITTLDFNIHNITFTTYMTFLTSSNVSHIFYLYMERVKYAYLVKLFHNLITFIHISSKGHKSTKQDTTFFTLSHITYHFLKHLGMNLIFLVSSYTLLYNYQYNHHNSYSQVGTIMYQHLRPHI